MSPDSVKPGPPTVRKATGLTSQGSCPSQQETYYAGRKHVKVTAGRGRTIRSLEPCPTARTAR